MIRADLNFPKIPVVTVLRIHRKRQGDHLRGHCNNLARCNGGLGQNSSGGGVKSV